MNHELFGWLGLILIQGSRIPQLYFTLKSKHVSGLSLTSNISTELGLGSYMIYSLIVHDRVFVASNFVGLMLNGVVCYYNYVWRNRKEIRIESVSDRVIA